MSSPEIKNDEDMKIEASEEPEVIKTQLIFLCKTFLT